MLKTEADTWAEVAAKAAITALWILRIIIPMNCDGLKEKIRI